MLDDPFLELPLSLADPIDADLRDDLDPALGDEENGSRRRSVLQAARVRVVRQVLGVEREGVGRREPPGDGGLQRCEEVATAKEEDAPRPTAQELERSRNVEVAPEVVKVERDDTDAVVVIHEGQGAAFAGQRTDRLGIHDRARSVEHAVHHDERGPFVDRVVVPLERDRHVVGRTQPDELGSGLRRPCLPHLSIRREVQFGEDDPVPLAREIEGGRNGREGDRDVRRERDLVRVASAQLGEGSFQPGHRGEDVLEPHVVRRSLGGPSPDVVVEVPAGAVPNRTQRCADQVRLATEDLELVAVTREVSNHRRAARHAVGRSLTRPSPRGSRRTAAGGPRRPRPSPSRTGSR